MIDFACKRFELDEVIKCGLGLTKSDFNIMRFLMQHDDKKFNSSEIAEKMHLNISTCQRSLKRLNERDIITRMQINLSTGGYIFLYKINNKKFISKLIMNVIHKWIKQVETALERW